MKVYCTECENKCSEDDAVCPKCGHRMQPPELPALASDAPQAAAEDAAVDCPVCDGACSAEANVCPRCSHPLKWHGPPAEVPVLHFIGGAMMLLGAIGLLGGCLAVAVSEPDATGAIWAGSASTMFLGLLTYAAGTALSLLAIIAAKR